ncbi:MAG: PAS domain S-box protein [Bacteroidia bacterium]|jgi:PAS domain S-box-containing protein|nr:PAS domain S-box protein [Bacteroidia bacterium]
MISWPVLFLFTVVLLIAAIIVLLLRLSKLQSVQESRGSEYDNFRSIVDLANDAILVIDIADGKILQSNPGTEKLLGYRWEDLSGRRFFDLVEPHNVERSSLLVADVWEKKGLIFSDLPLVTKAGNPLPVECSARVAPFAGRPAIVIYARDIRERLRMEQEIQHQAAEIEQKNRDITDSITYARKIQESILPTDEELGEVFPEHFVFYRPKDIVSGDFYWAASVTTTPPGQVESHHLKVVAAVDCTGHGVPGAFMSIIGHTLLNQTRTAPSVNSVAEALSYINSELLLTLRQRYHETALRDGMDMSMCAVNVREGWIEFAGANHPMYLIRNGALTIIKGDKQPIGRYEEETKPFTARRIALQPGDQFYLFSDGIADQFGGPKGKKFKYKRLQEVLLQHAHLPMKAQGEAFEKAIMVWMSQPLPGGGLPEQTDDMLLIGFKAV